MKLVRGFALFIATIFFITLASCRTVSEFVDGKITVNKLPVIIAIFVAAVVAALVAGWMGVALGGASGMATTLLSTTSPEGHPVFEIPPAPWYFDPFAYLRAALTWLGIAIVVGLAFERSRQQTFAFLRDLFSFPPHPIWALRRFFAAMGWLHSDPVQQPPHLEDMTRVRSRLKGKP
jgi:hypothetical protein